MGCGLLLEAGFDYQCVRVAGENYDDAAFNLDAADAEQELVGCAERCAVSAIGARGARFLPRRVNLLALDANSRVDRKLIVAVAVVGDCVEAGARLDQRDDPIDFGVCEWCDGRFGGLSSDGVDLHEL